MGGEPDGFMVGVKHEGVSVGVKMKTDIGWKMHHFVAETKSEDVSSEHCHFIFYLSVCEHENRHCITLA
jgi:hypothetical protein